MENQDSVRKLRKDNGFHFKSLDFELMEIIKMNSHMQNVILKCISLISYQIPGSFEAI